MAWRFARQCGNEASAELRRVASTEVGVYLEAVARQAGSESAARGD